MDNSNKTTVFDEDLVTPMIIHRCVTLSTEPLYHKELNVSVCIQSSKTRE